MKTTPLLPLLAAGLVSAASCTNTVSLTGASGTGAGTVAGAGGAGGSSCAGQVSFQRLGVGPVDKVDLVLMVDNSRSMADKQQVLALAIPDLVTGLVNPACVDASGAAVPASEQPAGPLDPCPSGTHRVVPPLLDMHVGLLSSSLGSFGADACPDVTNVVCSNMATSTSNNDHGHLVTRTDPCAAGHVTTYQGEGFLAWDPAQMLMPPGEGQVGSLSSPGLVESLHDLVVGDGQDGCGFESQNESWYRFLVDTSPYQSISLNGQNAQPVGIDNVLLQQRADFLRPDSLLVIVVVTDETDTSLKEYSFYPLFAQQLENGQPFHLPTARSECTTKGPTDPCCASCGENTPPGCPSPDPACMASATYTDATENLALRAFGLSGGPMSHKARYGIEFFYPPSRYIQALTSEVVQDALGNLVPNPIFSPNANDPHAVVRDPSRVLYAAITGVPWQLIARQKNGVPDLVNGVSTLDPTQVGGFKTFGELSQSDGQGNTFWDDIAGDPESYVPPISPFMRESTVPRTGTDPITGLAVSPPGSPNGTNPINGHEWNIAQPPGDIEYACIFPILTPIDCSQPGAVCDCTGMAADDNPLCDPNPNDNMSLTLQTRAKAYPGVKHLAIARGMQEQGIVASICPKQLTDPTQPDYGYRPAVKAIVDQLQRRLAGPCLAEKLSTSEGQAQCTILEATSAPTCNCETPGRSPIGPEQQCLVNAAQQDPLAASAKWTCFCQLTQASGGALTDCQENFTTQSTTNGWCYVDASLPSPLGNPALVARCPSTEQRELRFVGQGAPSPGATVFISCQ